MYTPKASGGYQGPAIPDGLYVLEVKDVTLHKATELDQWGNKKDKLRIKFEITDLVDEEGNPVYVDPLINNSLSDGADGRFPASTYWKVCVALGAEPESGIDSDNLIGLRCKGMIVTEDKEGAYPKVTQYTRIGKDVAVKPQNGSAPSSVTTAAVTPGIAGQRDLIAEAISLLPAISAQLQKGDMVEFLGLLCATFPEAESKGQFIPGKVEFENAAKFVGIVRDKLNELKEVPFAV